MVKEGKKRLMLTLSEEEIQKLKVIMFDLRTRQPSKAISFLIANYRK